MNQPIFRLAAALCLLWISLLSQVFAGQLRQDDIAKLFEERYVVGEVQAGMPAYPLFVKNAAAPDSKPELKAYAFETIDFSSVRGYSGKPIDLLVVMDLSGNFLSVRLIEHKEPIFFDSYGTAKLTEFAAQYSGLSLQHTIQILTANDAPVRSEHAASLRGVHRGTISEKAIDRTILSAAAAVALAKFAPPAAAVSTDTKSVETESKPPATVAEDKPASASLQALTTSGETQNASLKLLVKPPTQEDADKQQPLSIALNDKEESALVTEAKIENNAPLPVTSTQEQNARLHSLIEPDWSTQDWVNVWQSRWLDIAILLTGLLILSGGLIAQKRLSVNSRRLRILRSLYLLFTLGFIGWYAQGQLTIVNITAAAESLSSGGSLSFLMNDPMTVILWVFVAATLLVWGRGSFCGWLCPFGALQELISLISNAVGLRQRRLRTALDAKLKWVKYAVLATILASLYIAPSFAQRAVEIEPFKTAISFYFLRDWPYMLWATLCLGLSVFVYRGYCRYICPLGAALASVNFLQRWSWIPRRDACGTPCQSCRHRCEYQAIADTGKINYSECFQCLDCVSIYQDDQRCLPLIQQNKVAKRVISIQVLEEA